MGEAAVKTGLRTKFLNALGVLVMLGAAAPEAPVADAAMRGDLDAVRALLQQGADVNAAQGDGMTALHWAAEHGDADMTELLVYGGANVGAITRIGQYRPLHLAAKIGSAPVIAALLKAGADVAVTTGTGGATSLHLAAASGNTEAVALLLDRGADANAREMEWGQTPLIFAASLGRTEVVKLLLERGADASLTSNTLDYAENSKRQQNAGRRQEQVMEAFTAGDAVPTPGQVRAAVLAAREVFLSGAEVPEEAGDDDNRGGGGGGDPAVAKNGGLSALHHAVRQGHVDAVLALLAGGADIDQPAGAGATTPLLLATMNGQFDIALKLIERDADPNLASSDFGVAPLWSTINTQWQPRTRFPQPQEIGLQESTYLDVMEALLKAGADPNARTESHPFYMVYTGCGNGNCGLEDTRGSTAFWRASYGLDVDAMKLLVAYGADPGIATRRPPERRRNGGGGPLPTGEGDPEVDASGLPPVPVDGPNVYPIHAAAGVGYGEGFAGNAHRTVPDGWMAAVKYLVEELGADVNARDGDGYAPLHHAAARGHDEMILYLIEKGADITVVSRRDQTVADMANGPVSRVSPFPLTVALLERLGSKNNHRCLTC
jgi:ankyrin repeat protein